MKSCRPGRLWAISACLFFLSVSTPETKLEASQSTSSSGASGAQQEQTPKPSDPQPAKPPAQPKPSPFEAVPAQAEEPKPAEPQKPAQSKPQNPFESVPQAPEQPKPEAPQAPKPGTRFETPKPAAEQPAGQVQDIIEAIEFRGSRRIPQDTLRAMIFSKKGDRYDPAALQRDFMSLWNTGRFDDITIEREPGKFGWIVRFLVTERRVVRSIKYEGNKSVTISEILDRFKERRVGLSVESQFDQNKVQRATNVLKEFLAERGRQYATVTPEIRQIPPSSLEITFKVVEGPKVKVGNIDIVGNSVFSDRVVRRAMKNLRPVGIPHSILLENLFAKTYDSSKLEEDKERIRMFYMERGYFMARPGDHKVTMRDVGGGKFKIPLFYPNRPGKRADIVVPVEEGRQYKLRKINFVGVKLFRTPESLMRPLFQMGEGDVFSTAKLRKGLDELRKLYGNFGYIDMVPEPSFEPIPNTDRIDLTLNVDEGSQFFVRRIDFSGNTTTRDKVIRRELLIDEGDIFNTRLWEVSILRLNQLGYFEALKQEEAAQINRDTKTNTVDITLKVKERGKNSVSLNGGVSGIAGSFVGFGYSTNNFLGLGETLSLSAELGDRIRNATFGFTEPYFMDRPIQLGFTVYTQRFNYDMGREVSLFTGRNYIPYFESIGRDNLLNYISNGYGFTTFISYPLRRSFARVGLTYGYDRQNIEAITTASKAFFQYSNFQGLDGANQLSGIRTSRIIPSYSYNSVDHPITPTRGRSLYLSIAYAGGPLGGNVNLIEPTISATYFRSGFRKGHVIGMRGILRFVTGYGGRVVPPFNRIFMGGEQDVRGFEIWGISPIAYIPSAASVNVLNDDFSARKQTVVIDGVPTEVGVTQTIPIYQLIYPGGDTQVIANFEYRIPIVGPVTLAYFFDAGLSRITWRNQLRLNQSRVDELNAAFPQAGFTPEAVIAPGTQKIRTSTGLELQIMMPVVNAPFRLYWAYNPTTVQEILNPPIVADRSQFPNQATFINSILQFGQPRPFRERRRMFRFTISRTF
ncbi:MAG: outer membrane protein assembly factor BamA [Bryobacteraceae bacterium]|nr:outer membrane protein assembly factor BamA [Bryobacteraceae bacterium]